jgi:orotate phosphoribosyltransferase
MAIIDHGKRSCRCDRVRIAAGQVEPLDIAIDCSACFVFWTHPEINQAWGGTGALPVRKGEWPKRPAPRPVKQRTTLRPAVEDLVRPECRHRGAVLKSVDCKTCGGLKQVELHRCAKYQLPCYTGPAHPAWEEGARSCMACAARDISRSDRLGTRFRWHSTKQLIADALVLAAKLPADVVGVAGIPRSGMIPAAVIATVRHVALWQLTEDGHLQRLGHGSRGRSWPFPESGRVAVVDDSVYGGAAMRKARAALRGVPAIFAAVYVRPEAASVVDLFGGFAPSPHLFEWNLTNSGPFTGHAADPAYGAGVACDFDGIFCHDADSGGPVGTPYLAPRTQPCRLIVTGRPERDRAVTEEWMRRHGATWERLVMLPDGDEGTAASIAAHKARHYRDSKCGFFLESDPEQAERIFNLAGRPVICPRIERIFQ